MPDNQYTGCYFQSEILSKDILGYLIQDKDFDLSDVVWDDSKITIPDDLMSSWKKDVDPVTIDELTSRQAFGTGIFDAIMESIHNHLKIEYESGRITGAEYATTYTRLTEAGLSNAVQFCLQKNQAYYNGVLAQAQAVTAGIQAQIAALTAKVQLAKTKAEALGIAAEYALTTMKLATEDAQHALVCKQKAATEATIALTEAQTNTQNEQTAVTHEQIQQTIEQTILTQKQQDQVIAQTEHQQEQTRTQVEQTAVTHRQIVHTEEQTKLLQRQQEQTIEQTAVTHEQIYQTQEQTTLLKKQQDQTVEQTAQVHAQTDGVLQENQTRYQQTLTAKYQAMANDPQPPNGLEGTNIDFLTKEKNIDHIQSQMDVEESQVGLYNQQVSSYQRHDEKQVADLFSTAYSTMKAIDEGLAIPKAFSGASINEVLQNLKTKVNLGRDTTNITNYSIPTGSNSSQAYTGTTIPDPSEEGMNAERAYLQYGVLRTNAGAEENNTENDD